MSAANTLQLQGWRASSRGFVATVSCFLLATPLAAQDEPAIYPPGVAEQSEYGSYMRGTLGMFGSQPLWTDAAMEGHTRRYRATFDGGSYIRSDKVQVAIDEMADGSAWVSGTVLRAQPEDGTEQVRRELSGEEYATFLARVEENSLWKRLPESWRRGENTFCAHGRHVVLEKHDATGYGMSDAEHCTAPANMVRVLDAMLDLARFESRRQWRPGMWW